MKKPTEAQLRKQRDAVASQLAAIEKTRREKEHRKLIGKCFKYHNTYGSGEKWWLYARITGSDGYWPQAFTFQETSIGIFEARDEKCFTNSFGGYTEITRQEFDKAWVVFTNRLLRLNK